MIKSQITIGSDPEYAVRDEHGVARSAVGFIPGTKKEPFPLDETGEFSIQIDNVGVEGCIPPAKNKEEFVNAMMAIKQLTQTKLREQQPTWSLHSLSSARYSEEELDSETAQTFGCDPSYCVHTGQVSPRPSPEEVANLRSFGFHIHIGFELLNENESAIDVATQIIRAMDVYCGLGSILLDTDSDRRSIYGNAGDFRFRQIEDINIVEYRTLGGAMHDNARLIGWVYDQTRLAIQSVIEGKEFDNEMVAFAINNGEENIVRELIQDYNIQLPYDVKQRIKASAL